MGLIYEMTQKVITKLIPAEGFIMLGTSRLRFRQIIFFGGKATAETPNSATVYVQLLDIKTDEWVSAGPVLKGQFGLTSNIPTDADAPGTFGADQFRIKGTPGDGIVALITL